MGIWFSSFWLMVTNIDASDCLPVKKQINWGSTLESQIFPSPQFQRCQSTGGMSR